MTQEKEPQLLIENDSFGCDRAATIHFRVNGVNAIPEMYDYVKSEIIVDNYFQMEPICTIAHGDWPKTRVSISNDSTNSSFIYKGKVGKEEFGSNYELIQHILQIKNHEPSLDQGISQEFFTTTTTLRHIFKHKQDDVELHICVLKLGQDMYYNFGKIRKTGKIEDSKFILLEHLKKLTVVDDMFVMDPVNTPVIQKMLHEMNPLLESIDSYKLHPIDNKYASSMSGTVISPSIENTELAKLMHTFKYMDYE
ncbi:predicted protein [Naegleria gruberi]|uniref:Predicted protein n=1 Tax=Naegleria gruberi TaxID=5762 RepID=D2V4A1_NAEGR|nr:uncharacterized protein NAEGRDRAFT_46577 [Naegleria gruberi]EFC48348.1 predicted protein [Naegleria gruberi]|eukprot:XP_002681092.1 predicted protein [Naegleria gruberi strain NEG-M]